MSLDFNTSGRFVDHGSGASLDNLGSGGTLSVWAWVYRTTNGGNQHIVTKDGSYPSGWGFVCDNAIGEGEIRFVVFRTDTVGGNWTDAISTTGIVALNTWTFVAGTYDETASPEAKLYSGTLAATVAEVSSYYRQQNGTGAALSDAAYNLYVGNLQRATSYPFLGRIARAGVVNRTLSLAELKAIQYAPISQCNVNGTKLLVSLGDASKTQPDLSGNGNNGTVTSATDAPGLPLGATYGAMDFGANWANAPSTGHPTMRRWGGTPGMMPGSQSFGRSW